jgi:hypothetical protein
MVYKNKGVVKNGCCVVESAPPPCIPPTAGIIRINDLGPSGDPTYDTLYSYTVDQTNGTSFRWFCRVGETTTLLSDGGNVSGSQTPILLVKTKTTGCPPVIQPQFFVCDVSNNCGTARSENGSVQGCGF